ncbi:MAG: hypothetical protein LUE99_12270 [Bacteroides sp.]|nr:hypothetical protein [Bacteroides sp.]
MTRQTGRDLLVTDTVHGIFAGNAMRPEDDAHSNNSQQQDAYSHECPYTR